MGKGAVGAQRAALVMPTEQAPDEQALEQVKEQLAAARAQLDSCTSYISHANAEGAGLAAREMERLGKSLKQITESIECYKRAEARASVILGPRKGKRLQLSRVFHELPAVWADRPLSDMALRSPRGIRLQVAKLPGVAPTARFDPRLSLREQAARWRTGTTDQIAVQYNGRADPEGMAPDAIIVETNDAGDIVGNYPDAWAPIPLEMLSRLLHTDADRAVICKDILQDFHAVERLEDGSVVQTYDAATLTLGELTGLLRSAAAQPNSLRFEHRLRLYPYGDVMRLQYDSGKSALFGGVSVRLRYRLPSSPPEIVRTP